MCSPHRMCFVCDYQDSSFVHFLSALKCLKIRVGSIYVVCSQREREKECVSNEEQK